MLHYQDLIHRIKALNLKISGPHEAIALVLHFLMLAHGFRGAESPELTYLPPNWKQNGLFSFSYKYGELDKVFFMKCLIMGSTLVVNASAGDELPIAFVVE